MGKNYFDIVGDVSPSANAGSKVYDLVAALTPPPSPSAPGTAMVPAKAEEHKKSATSAAVELIPFAVGAGVGYKSWKKHPVLGAMAGGAAATAAYELYKGKDKKEILSQLAVEAAAVLGGLYYKKHPALGYIGAGFVAAIASSFVPGTAAAKARAKIVSKV